jgi:hypothetical protein
LASAVREPVPAGGDTEKAFELPREVTLIGESAAGRDRSNPFVRTNEPVGGPLESESSTVLTDALSETGAEQACEVGVMGATQDPGKASP